MLQLGCASRSLLAGIVLGLVGCSTIPPASISMSKDELRVNDELRKRRANILNMSLEDKIAVVEKNIEDNLVNVGDGLLLPLYSEGDGNAQIYLDNNALFLSALSAKYSVTKDLHTKRTADAVIKGIREMDKLNGFDGYIPLTISANGSDYTSKVTHANAYDQLFFSYLTYTKNVGESPDIREHISKIYNMFADRRFALRDENGEIVSEANMNVGLFEFNPSNAIGRRSLDIVAITLGDKQTRERALRNKWSGVTFPGLVLDLGFLQIPTPSSSWLNMLNLYTLNECGQESKEEMIYLSKKYSDMQNPFLQILAYKVDKSIDISWVKKRLKEYPYPISDERIVNSHRKDLDFRRKRYIKNSAKLEVKKALPLYELSGGYNLWKRNLLQADKHGSQKGRKYFGVDLLQAYWFFEMVKKRDSE